MPFLLRANLTSRRTYVRLRIRFPILNIFSYSPTAAVKILHFLQPHIYSVLLFKRKDYFQSQPLGYSGHGHQFFF